MKLCFLLLATASFLRVCPCKAQSPVPSPPTGTAEHLYAVYLARDYFALKSQLGTLGPRDLRRGFFEGQLAAALLQDDQAEEKLLQFLGLPNSEADWRKEAWLALGNGRLRRGDYRAAARALAQALNEPHAQFTAPERLDAEENLALARALEDCPSQTVVGQTNTSTVNASRGKSGMVLIDVKVNQLTEAAVFDTGANGSIVSEAFARRHHLHLLPDQIDVTSSTGKTLTTKLGLADEVQIGKMIFHHVIFAVIRDQDSSFPDAGLTIDATVGLNLILPLKHLRVAADGNRMEIGLPSASLPLIGSEWNLAFDGMMPLVQLQYQSSSLPFLFDTGMNQTLLYVRFGQRFPRALEGVSTRTDWLDGMGSRVAIRKQIVPSIELRAHDVPVVLHGIGILTEEQLFNPPVFGLIGEDFLPGGFELDFNRMEFSLIGTN